MEGNLDFINNNAESSDGGALYVTSYGQVVLQRGAEINFTGNRGHLGSAVVVESQLVGNGFDQLAYNPQCFLQYRPNSTLSPLEWNEVTKSTCYGSVCFCCVVAKTGDAFFYNT